MEILFYVNANNNKCPVNEFIKKLESKDKAKILGCLKNIEELGFDCPRVQFRQIRRNLWEIKIRSASAGFRIFYVCIKGRTLVLLHAYQKQMKKAPKKEIAIAEQRMLEVINNEKNDS
ncbi:MAG: type II toxin-antitoxin system RelE/ParE family toxin [Gammaproteobacteria bacterium]|nr:type II toxin-antitoxin system RelE/ParE family toxin [Gammaproteobacteria bacterium]